jgi:hypothetical protein
MIPFQGAKNQGDVVPCPVGVPGGKDRGSWGPGSPFLRKNPAEEINIFQGLTGSVFLYIETI